MVYEGLLERDSARRTTHVLRGWSCKVRTNFRLENDADGRNRFPSLAGAGSGRPRCGALGYRKLEFSGASNVAMDSAAILRGLPDPLLDSPPTSPTTPPSS